MASKTYKKQRKPIILMVCEGRNQTERLYFSHFIQRNSPYSLKIINSEATDCASMARKASRLFIDYQMDKTLGDRAFCLIDLDLQSEKEILLSKLKAKYKNIEFIVSNPCFEIWLMYYFTADPPVKQSSRMVKEYMNTYVCDYTESTDIISKCSLQDDYAVAINRSENKNKTYAADTPLADKNPYSEVQNAVLSLIELRPKQ